MYARKGRGEGKGGGFANSELCACVRGEKGLLGNVRTHAKQLFAQDKD